MAISSSSSTVWCVRSALAYEAVRVRQRRAQKTDTHIYIVMAFCSSGDLSQYIRRRGLSASIARNFPSTAAPLNERFPNPREGGLNEVIVRCFLGQLSELSSLTYVGRGI